MSGAGSRSKVTEAEAWAVVGRIVREELERPNLIVTPELSARDVPGWTSLKQVSILLAIEERFGFELQASDLDGLSSVGDLVRVLLIRSG